MENVPLRFSCLIGKMMALTMWVSCAARTNYDFGYNQEERVMGPYLRPIAPNSAFSSVIGLHVWRNTGGRPVGRD